MSDCDVYLYAFTRDAAHGGLAGLDGTTLESLCGDGVCAVVGPAPVGRLRPQRKHLAAHHSVLAALAVRTTTLPATFGMIAPRAHLLDILDEHAERLREQIDEVSGCVEMGVRLRWDVPDVFSHLVDLDDELRHLRAELVARGDRAPHDLRVAVGRRVEVVLAAHRGHHHAMLSESLGEHARRVLEQPVSGEAELAHLALLVEQASMDSLENALHGIASDLDERYAIAVAGPFAPHHFVSLELDLGAASGAA